MSSADDPEPLTNPADDVKPSGAEDGAEDEEECGWCRWMKAGGCKTEFQVWLDCVDAVKAAGREDVESCASIMGPLWECMERHREYYAPQLDSLAERRQREGGGEGTGGGEGERVGEGEDDMLEGGQGAGSGGRGEPGSGAAEGGGAGGAAGAGAAEGGEAGGKGRR